MRKEREDNARQGFACAFHILYRTEQQKFEEYSTTWRSLYTVRAPLR